MLIPVFLVFGAIISSGWCITKGGPCYSKSQKHCELTWDKLWEAQYRRQNGDICRYFEEVHKCTTAFTRQCGFNKAEKELYNTDIVKTYTGDKYRCPMMGGNMMMKADEQDSALNRMGRNNSSFLSIYLAMFGVILYSHKF